MSCYLVPMEILHPRELNLKSDSIRVFSPDLLHISEVKVIENVPNLRRTITKTQLDEGVCMLLSQNSSE